MSIERDGGYYVAVCDVCGDCLGEEDDFYAAVEAKKAAGWRSRKANGEWEDVCESCQGK